MTINIHSAEWNAITEWANTEIEAGRDELESPHTDDKRTALIRGRLEALRSLLDLPNG